MTFHFHFTQYSVFFPTFNCHTPVIWSMAGRHQRHQTGHKKFFLLSFSLKSEISSISSCTSKSLLSSWFSCCQVRSGDEWLFVETNGRLQNPTVNLTKEEKIHNNISQIKRCCLSDKYDDSYNSSSSGNSNNAHFSFLSTYFHPLEICLGR